MNIPSAVDIISHQSELAQAYKIMLTNIGIQGAKNIQVSMYHGMGDCDVSTAAAGNVVRYFSPGNQFNGALTPAELLTNKAENSMFHGSLYINSYVDSLTPPATASMNVGLTNGPNSGLNTWIFKFRTGIAGADGLINSFNNTAAPPIAHIGFLDKFENTFCNYIRMSLTQVGVGAVAVRSEWYATGVLVQYSS